MASSRGAKLADRMDGPPAYSAVGAAMPSINFGPESQSMECPHCRSLMMTTVKSKSTTKTHLIALLLCCFLCWPCAWMPYCCASCQNRAHYCSKCKAFLGVYEG